MLFRAVSILPATARNGFGQVRARSGTFWHVRTLSGRFGRSLKVPESARQCRNCPELVPSSFG
eukprot:14457341-Alexandrium_andersonii.AAC.1